MKKVVITKTFSIKRGCYQKHIFQINFSLLQVQVRRGLAVLKLFPAIFASIKQAVFEPF